MRERMFSLVTVIFAAVRARARAPRGCERASERRAPYSAFIRPSVIHQAPLAPRTLGTLIWARRERTYVDPDRAKMRRWNFRDMRIFALAFALRFARACVTRAQNPYTRRYDVFAGVFTGYEACNAPRITSRKWDWRVVTEEKANVLRHRDTEERTINHALEGISR